METLEPDTTVSETALSLTSVTRQYGGTVALNNVSFELKAGEVHALVGENGAGKSTLIKMMTGAEFPNEGTVNFFGEDCTVQSARERRESGISAIYQELSIVPAMSALDNIFLDKPPRRGFFLDRRAMRAEFERLQTNLGVSFSPDALAGRLSIADRQVIEIMRAMRTKCRVLIMDEPTATLGPSEREKLFDLVADLRSAGTAVIYISHDLDEVIKLADRVSVLRNGNLVATGAVSDWTKEGMVTEMLGKKPEREKSTVSSPFLGTAMKVTNLSVPGRVSDINLEVQSGEIVGIAGLVGSGRTEILHALAGLDSTCSGRLEISSRDQSLPWTLAEAVKNRVCLVPEDRKEQGIVPLMSGWANVALTDLHAISRNGIVDAAKGRQRAAETTAPLAFDPARLDSPIGTLSGGNQQKLVIGKWLQRGPDVLLLDEPTRGVDIGARAEIYRAIRDQADSGLAVVLVSSDFEEIIEHADRIVVISRGRFVAEVPKIEATPKRILSLIFLSEESQP